ncbi:MULTISPECIES: phage integrase [Providencia]|uniref:phage integrase n=1 Tax=Providencia TaxID=586 RepID=UPI000197C46A|nr:MULTISPECIES: tyrosine-type recombinase/integrase [Providencia]EFE55425.1 site-specific recombinase, phage integrase family [Providencia rettgeri DSM 1131]QXA56190.1 tyrosine-type recombinase/integrase [Providencia rettgeri]UFK92862.1 tyrosine-type recombinase/integrase [Providencia rettgeri]HEM7541155.1 tyrosine-type recombinase/integrase [Providencia rettgeri]
MAIKKLEDGQYEVDIRPAGRQGKRVRRRFDTKHEAVLFERYALSNKMHKDWLDKSNDIRPLQDLIDLWWNTFGKSSEYAQDTLLRATRIATALDNPPMCLLTDKQLALYRELRLAAGIKPSTINRDFSAISGIFTALKRTDLFMGKHPIRGLSRLKQKATEMSYLTHEEIGLLLNILKGDNKKVAILCLSTGARWGEAVKLKREHVIQNKIRFTFTKTGKARIVPISQEVADKVCTRKSGLLFPNTSYDMFRKHIKTIKPDMPQGQATHALRHTFATHFMMNGGSIITLQRILGHSTLQQTLTYAHFAPDFLQDAITYNPLKGGTELA